MESRLVAALTVTVAFVACSSAEQPAPKNRIEQAISDNTCDNDLWTSSDASYCSSAEAWIDCYNSADHGAGYGTGFTQEIGGCRCVECKPLAD
jgi:hypothetical protein